MKGRLEYLVARVEVLSVSLAQHQCPELEVSNQADLLAGLARLEAWADAGHRAFRAWLEQSGGLEARAEQRRRRENSGGR